MKKIVTLVLGLMLFSATLSAQSLTDLLKGAATSIVDNLTGGKATELLLPGTWTYVSPAVRLTSSDAIAEALGSATTASLETKLKKVYDYAGIKAGSCSFTFTTEDAFTMTVGKRSYTGKYTYDAPTHKLELVFNTTLIKLGSMSGYAYIDGDNVDLVFDCSKLFDFVVKLGTKVSALGSLTKIAENYDGMMLGFSLSRTK